MGKLLITIESEEVTAPKERNIIQAIKEDARRQRAIEGKPCTTDPVSEIRISLGTKEEREETLALMAQVKAKARHDRCVVAW